MCNGSVGCRRCLSLILYSSICSFLWRYKPRVCEEVVLEPPLSNISVNLEYFDGLSNGRLSFILSFSPPTKKLRLQVRGGKLINHTSTAHAKPKNMAVKMRTSSPYGKYQITLLFPPLAMFGCCCCSYAALGTMASGYKKPGGDGRGYVERLAKVNFVLRA
jgi:hypothetical protein